MNAGAYKSDMGYIVQEVKLLTPDYKIITLENKELNFHYRSSFLQKHPARPFLAASKESLINEKPAPTLTLLFPKN